MKPKHLVYCLVVICIIFSWCGIAALDEINEVIDLKDSSEFWTCDFCGLGYDSELKEKFNIIESKICDFKEMMLMTIVLLVVMGVCLSFKKNCS